MPIKNSDFFESIKQNPLKVDFESVISPNWDLYFSNFYRIDTNIIQKEFEDPYASKNSPSYYFTYLQYLSATWMDSHTIIFMRNMFNNLSIEVRKVNIGVYLLGFCCEVQFEND